MDKHTRIISKIKALLNKTVENGATEAEALSAISKANELMIEYYITDKDLLINELGQIVNKEYRLKFTYKSISTINTVLAKLFTCDTYYRKYYNDYIINFVGYETDVELCLYFYNYLIKVIEQQLKEIVTDLDFRTKVDFEGVSTRKAKTEFVNGLVYRLNERISLMYTNQQTKTSQTGLTVIDTKLANIDSYMKEHTDVLYVDVDYTSNDDLFDLGMKTADTIDILQPINQPSNSTNPTNILKIN